MATHPWDLKASMRFGNSIRRGTASAASANGSGVDLRYCSGPAVAIADCGTITDGTHTITFEQSRNDNTADVGGAADPYAAVPEADEMVLNAAKSGTVVMARVFASEPYVRAVVTVAGATTGGIYGIMIGAPKKTIS
jgi:hypothetical protein